MSSHSTNIQFKSILHQVLKMTPFCSYSNGFRDIQWRMWCNGWHDLKRPL